VAAQVPAVLESLSGVSLPTLLHDMERVRDAS
jgi:hypothetical protein